MSRSLKDKIKSIPMKYWLIIEFGTSVFIVFLIAPALADYVQPDLELAAILMSIGSDAITLMGFIIEALAIVSVLISRTILDKIRDTEEFGYLWKTFALTALILGIQAIWARMGIIFIFPEFVYQCLMIVVFFNVFLILDCIILLVLLVNVTSVGQNKKRGVPKKPRFAGDKIE